MSEYKYIQSTEDLDKAIHMLNQIDLRWLNLKTEEAIQSFGEPFPGSSEMIIRNLTILNDIILACVEVQGLYKKLKRDVEH